MCVYVCVQPQSQPRPGQGWFPAPGLPRYSRPNPPTTLVLVHTHSRTHLHSLSPFHFRWNSGSNKPPCPPYPVPPPWAAPSAHRPLLRPFSPPTTPRSLSFTPRPLIHHQPFKDTYIYFNLFKPNKNRNFLIILKFTENEFCVDGWLRETEVEREFQIYVFKKVETRMGKF